MTNKTNSSFWFYGWVIVAMGLLGNALQGGFVFWSMGLYAATFEDVFQETRARINIAEACLSVAVNVLSPIVGLLVDRYSARNVVVIGTVCCGLGLIVLSMAGTLLHIWIVFATLIPLGVLALGVFPSAALISRWFKRHRGLGLGISVTGSSLGGMVVPLVLGGLFLTLGWRTTLLAAGIFVICIAPVFFVLLANYPEDRGCQQLGAGKDESKRESALGSNWTIRRLVRQPMTYVQAILAGSLLAITLGVIANLGFHAKDLGFTSAQIGKLYAVVAVTSFCGKLITGMVIDRYGIVLAIAVTTSILAAAMITFLNVDQFAQIYGAALVLGLGMGGVTPVWTAMIADAFGPGGFGRAIGLQNPMHIPLTAASAPLAGHISDTTGSYELVFVMYLGFTVVAAVALLFMWRLGKPIEPDAQPAIASDAFDKL